ncbi:SMEK domain-containing protein [Serratia fonticola]
MITSGYLIGQIIDELSDIAQQAKIRNKLGYTDLSVFVEDFFKVILNETFGFSLLNLNRTKANEPGLDLGDKKNRIAFQVTTNKASNKVIHTLIKITPEQRDAYDCFKVLIVGDKQDKYDAVITALENRTDTDDSSEENEKKIHEKIMFEPSTDIIDLTDLVREIVALDITNIQNIHTLVQNQTAKVKIELQVPDIEGNYPTSGYDFWESLPEPELGDGSRFAAWELEQIQSDRAPSADEIKAVRNDIEEIARRLNMLPRVTREFFAMLHERAEYKRYRFDEYPSIFYNVVLKTYDGAKLEIELLSSYGLISIEFENDFDEEKVPGEIGLYMYNLTSPGFGLGFHDFVKKNNLSFRDVLGKVDFSGF